MQLEQTSAHLDARLQASGLGRLGSAGFLGIWLIFWAMGEVLVLWFVGVGAWSLLTGNPPRPDRTPLSAGVALPVGLFLLFWLALWTVGGLAAAHEFLRLLFGRDLILAESGALLVVHSYGLFRTRHQVTREHLHRFYQLPSKTALMIETRQGGMEVTRLGTADERGELAQLLNSLFGLRAEPGTEGTLPAGWCEGLSPEHSSVLMPDPKRRRRAAIAVWLVFGLFSSVTLYVIPAAVTQPTLWAIGLMLSVVAATTGWGGLGLTLGRNEWKLDRSRLVLQRRFGTNCRPVF